MTGTETSLFEQVKSLIEQSRRQVAVSVNAELTLLYWHVGKTISQDLLDNKRAEYGKRVVSVLARQLLSAYGNGFSEKNLRRMMQFADTFPDLPIVVSLTRQLSWTHFIVLIPIQDTLKRYEMQPGELPPIGLLLCSEGNTEHIELLMLDQSDIRVAQYLTELPPKEWFIDKLHRALAIARQQLDDKRLHDSFY